MPATGGRGDSIRLLPEPGLQFGERRPQIGRAVEGPLRIILTLLIPEAPGPLILGYTFVVIAIVDMSAMAGTVGGGGLGDFVLVYGYQRFAWRVTLVATLIIIAGVQGIQFFGNWLARKVLRR